MNKKVKLNSICEILDNKRKPLSDNERQERIKNKNIDDLYPYYGATKQVGYIDDYIFNDELILLGEDGVMFYDPTKPKAYLIKGKSWVNNHAHVLKIDNTKANTNYILYYLNIFNYQGYVSGSTRLKLNKSKMCEIPIPLPSLEKQNQIAKTLDKANELIELRKESITKLDALAKSIFIDMFGDPVSNHKKFDIKLLDEVSLKITDGEHGTVERTDTGKMYLMARNISHFGTIDFSDVSYISEENHNRIYKRCNAEYNDLLLVCVGATIGKCTLVPKMESFSLARSVALIKPLVDKILSNYLLYFFRSEYIGREIKSASNSSAQAGLYLGAIKKIKIIVPPLDLQNKFAKIIEKIEEQKTLYTQELEKLQENFDALLQKSFQ